MYVDMSHPEMALAINGIGQVLSKLVDRMHRTEEEVSSIIMKSKKSSSTARKKKPVPLVVRVG